MAIRFNNSFKNHKLKNSAKLKLWITEQIDSEKKICGKIDFYFINDEELLELNKHFLNHSTYTDIITFDYTEGKKISGELFISLERVIENAKKFEVEMETELHRVMIHGIFHLCGYKDKSEAEIKKIRGKENTALIKRTAFEII